MVDRQLHSVQILRGVAAFAVVLAHLVMVERKHLPGDPVTTEHLELGASGVDLFFVISGFIMTAMTLGRPPRPGDGWRFLVRRFTRIYPLYWFYLLLLLPVFITRPAAPDDGQGGPNLLSSFLLLPDENQLLIVAWTLSFELYFYLVFTATFQFMHGWRGVAVLTAWGLVVAAGNLLLRPGSDAPLLSLLFSPLNLEFIAGCFIARLAAGVNRWAGTACLLAAGAVFCAGAYTFGTAPLTTPELAWTRVLVFGTAASLLLIGALGWERATRRAPGVFVKVGDASYSLYLSHLLTLGAVGWIWESVIGAPDTLHRMAMVAVAVTAALVWGWISFVVLERPLLALSREALRRIEPARRRDTRASAGRPA